MNPLSSLSEPVPRIITNWRRFSSGLWRIPKGDIAEAYSADTFPKIKTFAHENRIYTNSGGYSKMMHAEVNAYPLVPFDEYDGPQNVAYSYQGDAVTSKGKAFRLGPKITFVSSGPAVNEWRHLLRAMFSDGGLFASGCDYREFLASRCILESENGRAAESLEVAACANLEIPNTKKEMAHWLDNRQTTSWISEGQLDLAL
jgi:hypothetical protein